MLNYSNGIISSAYVPDETSLCIQVADRGQPLLEHLPIILQQYQKYITCLCLMGGDHDQSELRAIFKQAHEIGLKTCLYTGLSEMSMINKKLLDELDYIKLGPFIKEKGPLNNPSTNQRMYKKDYSPFDDCDDWYDITEKFWPKEDLL